MAEPRFGPDGDDMTPLQKLTAWVAALVFAIVICVVW